MGLRKMLLSKIVTAVTAFALVFSVAGIASFSASAVGGASDEVKRNENGVVRIGCVYGESEIPVLSRTGFIINNTTIITSKEILGYNAEEILRRTQEQNNELGSYDRTKLKYKVKIGKVYVNATNRMKDTEMQFAILGLETPIDLENSSYTQLLLGDSDRVETTQTVYSIGFATNDNKYIINEVKVTRTDNTDNFIQFTMSNPVDGFIGSPVIDDEGAVVALTYSKRTDGYNAVPINEVISVCNDFGIQKSLFTGEVIQPSVEPSREPSREPSIEPSREPSREPGYVSAPESSSAPIGETSRISDDDSVVPAQNEDNTMFIIIVAGIGVVVVILIIVMVALATKKKPVPAPVSYPPVPMPPAPSPAPSPSPYDQTSGRNAGGGYGYVPQGAGETSLLDEGSGETTILGGSATAGVPSGVLVNLKTGERVIINKPEFAIGKERSRVDYCISDDNSVSRLHLKVRVRGGRCYVVDMGSKNGTYLNGSKLIPNQEMPIQNGDRLKVSLIEFEFKG